MSYTLNSSKKIAIRARRDEMRQLLAIETKKLEELKRALQSGHSRWTPLQIEHQIVRQKRKISGITRSLAELKFPRALRDFEALELQIEDRESAKGAFSGTAWKPRQGGSMP